MSELVITNGDAAAELLAAAGLPGHILPWRDVLYEGPLLAAQSLSAFSDVRAVFLSERFGIPYAEAKADFLARDAVVSAHRLFERVSIWLEHDLYDQLQLLQILDFFHREGRSDGITLIQADDFIATQNADAVLRIGSNRSAVTGEMLRTAASVWAAVCAATPEPVVRLAGTPVAGFRHLAPALLRFLDELPSAKNGLARSARVMLAGIGNGRATPRELFSRLLASEDAAFMGDWSAFRVLDDMAFAAEPLVTGLTEPFPCRGPAANGERYLAASLSLTAFGRMVVAGETDALAVNGIDRWWAGTHMAGLDAWRWDAAARRLVAPRTGSN